MKNLADAPVCLQRMLLRLQDYDFTIKYCPGEEMVIADTLSRHSPEDTPEILLDISVNHIYIDAEKKWDYQLTIKDDPLLSTLVDMIITGWPDNIKDVPKALRPYHGQHDSLTVEDGLILCGEAIIIPLGGRKKVLEQIHQRHLGTSKCQYRARQCIYWPGINKDIKQQVEACTTYQRHWPQEPRQQLKPTPPPEQPWQQLKADFMTFDGSEYLVIVDYYSKMPVVWKMPTSQCNSARTITVLKELFAEHGIPKEIRSDNGSQFSSHLFAEFTKDWNIFIFSKESQEQWTSKICSQDCQRSAYPWQVLRTGSISSFVSIQEHPSWFSSTITCRDALSVCSMHNCITKDQIQGPPCSS